MNLQGNSVGYIGAFISGILTSFSPCIYPLIPVTLSFIGVKAGAWRLKGLTLSLIYVLGLAITYSILGLVAAFTGRFFGEVARHPLSLLVVGNVCILAGLSFLDVIASGFIGIRLQHKIKPLGSYLSVFLLGLTSGLVISPCVSPVLGVILAIVATKQDIIYGATLLFVFAYGMGFFLILVGTFGSIFLNLSKSQAWFNRIRKISGLVLIAIGEYFIFKAGGLM